jgi:exocyst complex component 7
MYALFIIFSKPIEPDRLFDCLPKSLRPSSGGEENNINSKHENQAKSLEAAVYKPPALIPPRVLPLLHDLAQQLVQAGHLQQCFKIYRLEQSKHDWIPQC